MKIDNELTRLLGIKHPIIQGAMGIPNTGTSQIAAPVSEAGGLGILTTIAFKTPDMFEKDVKKATSMTDKPLAVNYSLMEDRGFGYDFHEEYLKIAIDEGIKIGFTSAYDGYPIGKKIKDAGGVWVHKCATIRHAISTAKKGVDAIVIVGLEGTGFKSPEQNSTLINMTAGRKIIDAPLIAAGGIADGYGLIAALGMGACGIYMGTGFMATKEFPISDGFKQKIVTQEITDMEYVKSIYQMKHHARASLASGVIDSIPTVKEYIDNIMAEADEIMSKFGKWGMI